MGTILASEMIARLRITLLDPTPGDTWTDTDLLNALNEAQRRVCAVKLNAFRVRGFVPLVAGVHQALPAGGLIVLDFNANQASGRQCTKVDRSLMDAAARFYPAATQEVDAQHWIGDPVDPAAFDVVPPNTGAGQLYGLYGAVPTVIAAVGNVITLDDLYEMPLKHFVLAECYAANTKRQDLVKATSYATSAERMLGGRAQGEVAYAVKNGAPRGT